MKPAPVLSLLLLSCAPRGPVPPVLTVAGRQPSEELVLTALPAFLPIVHGCLEEQGVRSGAGPQLSLELAANGSVVEVDARGPGAHCVEEHLVGQRGVPMGHRARLEGRVRWRPAIAEAASQVVTGSEALELLSGLEDLLRPPQPDALLRYLDTVPDHELVVLFPAVVTTLTAASGGEIGRCEELAMGATVVAQKKQGHHHFWAHCDPCFGPWSDDFLNLEDAERTALLVDSCDAKGPDPVFGGPSAQLRGRMPWLDYAANRVLVQRYLERQADRGVEGQRQAEALQARLPRLAWVLAHQREARVVGDMQEQLYQYQRLREGGREDPFGYLAGELLGLQWSRGWGSPGAKKLQIVATQAVKRGLLEHYVASLADHGCQADGSELLEFPPRSAAEVALWERCDLRPLPDLVEHADELSWPSAWMLEASMGELRRWTHAHDRPELWDAWSEELPRQLQLALDASG